MVQGLDNSVFVLSIVQAVLCFDTLRFAPAVCRTSEDHWGYFRIWSVNFCVQGVAHQISSVGFGCSHSAVACAAFDISARGSRQWGSKCNDLNDEVKRHRGNLTETYAPFASACTHANEQCNRWCVLLHSKREVQSGSRYDSEVC